jgi:hypothetical protein
MELLLLNSTKNYKFFRNDANIELKQDWLCPVSRSLSELALK